MAQVTKGVLTQGTHVWIKHGDPVAPTLTRVSCVKTISFGDDSQTEIDSTCLDETDTKTSEWGLNTPGEGSLAIDTDPENASHMTLLQAASNKETVEVYVGWSDGIGVPALTGAAVTLPETRTWSSFTAKLRENSPVFDADSLVNHTIPMKRQTRVVTAYKTTTA